MPTELLQPGQAVLLSANVIYSLPGNAVQLAFGSVAGATLNASVDGTNFSAIGTVGAGAQASVFTAAMFIRTTAADVTVVVKQVAMGVVPTSGLSTINFPLGNQISEISAGQLNFISTGTVYASGLLSTGFSVLSNRSYSWSSGNTDPAASIDTQLLRGGAGRVVISGGATPMLQLAGSTASEVAIKRNGAVLESRLANDSNYCSFQALNCLATTNVHAGNGSSVTAGGTNAYGLRLSTGTNLGVFCGSGVPTMSAGQGSIYIRTDGSSTTTRCYINTDGGTTWTAVTTVA